MKRFLPPEITFSAFLLVILAPLASIAQTPGSLDPAYKNPATDNPVQVVVAQTVDGGTKAIIGGSFGALLDDANTPAPGLARFNADGSLDAAFFANISGTTLGAVTALALQPDGKLLVAGRDSSANTSVLLRFNADGTPDTAFHVTLNDDVESIAFPPDGSILISGLFTTVNGAGGQRRLARLSPAGMLDTSFQAYTNNALTVTEVKRIAVLPGGGLLAVTHVSNGDVDYLIQLAATDGSVPNAPAFYHLANDGRIYDVNVDTAGRVIVVGNFDGIDGHPRASHIARFGADGQIDNNFVGNPSLPSVLLQSVTVDVNGQPLVGGVSFGGSVLFRLTADTGAIDSTFSFPLGGDGNYIQSLALQTDGALLAAGQFSIGQRAANLLRVVTGTNPTSPNVTVAVPGTSNLWLAGAAAGTTASTGQDTLANATPFLVSGLAVTPGAALTFRATGNVSNDPANPVTVGPDGGPYLGSTIYNHIVENGVSGLTAPINSLIGVFLDGSTPAGPPPDGLDFSANTDYATLAPALRQPFFIGDGITSAGVAQSITVPAGATRLYLGSLDPSDQENNVGFFQVAIASGTTAPTPTPTPPPGTTPTPTPTPTPVPANTPILAVNPDDFTYSVKGQPNTGAVVPNDQITYSITVRNKGTAPAANVVVRASFDSTNTKFKEADHGGTASANLITWTLPVLNNGDHVTLTYTVRVKLDADTRSDITIGSVVQSAAAAAPAAPAANLPSITLRLVPFFNILTTDNGPTTIAGSALTYTFTVFNRGATLVKNITADVHLPLGYTKSNFSAATLIDNNGNPTGPAFPLGANLGNGQFDPAAVRVVIPSLAAGASQRFIVTLNIPVKAVPGSTITLVSVNLSGITDTGAVSFAQNNYQTTISTNPPAAPPSLLLLKLTPTASNLSTFLAAAKDSTTPFYKPAQQFFLALALYTGQSPDALEAMSADQLAALLNPYVTRDTDPDTGDSIFDVPSPNAKQPAPYVTYLLVYVNLGAGDAAGITITDAVAPTLKLDRSSITFKGAADVKGNVIDADGHSLTFTFGKVKHGAGGLIIYRANVPAPGKPGKTPNLGDVIDPITASLTTDSLSGQTFYTPAESLLITGAANAIVDSSQADVGDGTTIYTIYYKNTGGQKSKDFIVVSAVPAGGAFQSADFLDIGQSVIPGSIYPDGTKHISATQYIEPISYNATSGRVAFHLGKVKPRGQGLVQVKYKVTDAALAQKPAGLVHHYYVAGGSFPGTTSAMRAGRPLPRWAHQGASDRAFNPGDTVGVFKQGFDNVTNAVGGFFGFTRTDVAPTIWTQRIAPMAVQENSDFAYFVTIGNNGKIPAYTPGIIIENLTGATYKSIAGVQASDGFDHNSLGEVLVIPQVLQPGEARTFSVTYHTTAQAGSTVDCPDMLGTGLGGPTDFSRAASVVHTGRTSSLVYSADQARNFPALQTTVATNAAQAGGLDPSTLTASPKFAAHAGAITPNSTQTAIAHADYYTTTNGLTLVAQGGGNVIASGPSNLIAQGGGNLVAQGAGNLVAQGGGNLTFNNIPGFGATVTASSLLSSNGVATLISQDGGNLVAQGGGNLIAQGGGNLIDLGGAQFAISTLSNASTLVAGQGNAQSLGLISQDGGGLISQDGGGLISQDGGGLISQDGGGLKFVGGAAALISQDGGGFHTSAFGGGQRETRASRVKPGTLLGSPANSVSLDFNNAGGMVFGVGGSRANGQ